MPNDMVSVKYVYYEYVEKQFASQEELNALLKLILSQDTTLIRAIVTAVKIAAAVAVMWIRDRNIDKAMTLEKQGYMIKRNRLTEDMLRRDPLDVERRPSPTP